jgi:hypothetical protein
MQAKPIKERQLVVRRSRIREWSPPETSDLFINVPSAAVSKVSQDEAKICENVVPAKFAFFTSAKRLYRLNPDEGEQSDRHRFDVVFDAPALTIGRDNLLALQRDRIREPTSTRMRLHPLAKSPALLL